MIILGARDDVVPARNHADRLIQVPPRSVDHAMPGGGHQPHHVHATQVAGWIQAFAADVTEAGP